MTHLFAIVASIAGFACLCASMKRHQKVFISRLLSRRAQLTMRWAGWAMLGIALAIDIMGFGPGYGAVAWFGHLTLGAALVLARLNRAIRKSTA